MVQEIRPHFGELFPRVGFIVTNLSLPSRAVVRFYNKRGTAEQWIKEGKNAIKWTRLSCRSFAANAVRLQLHALAYNLGNSLIEAVNVLGSLFYGVILGIFLVAFYRKKIGGTSVFISALIVEAGVIILNILSRKGVVPLSFLWFNVVGAIGVVLLSEAIHFCSSKINTRSGDYP